MNHIYGDPVLGQRALVLIGKKKPVAAVAAVTPEGVRIASWGADLEADYEIGSISKGITGLLYADAIKRGEITPATTFEECLPLEGSEIGRVTLAAASIHRSGLGALPSSESTIRSAFQVWRKGTNPYAGTVDDLVASARAESPRSPRPRYSNFGFQLLGHALAARAGTTYADLVSTRIADPLELKTFYVPKNVGELRPGALTGCLSPGKPRPPWLGEAIGPAGGIRSTIGDMATLAASLLNGTAPGIAALDPVADMTRKMRVGAGWMTIENKGRSVTWHNGGTGGFRSWMGVDRGAGTGVVLLCASFDSMDNPGFRLLAQITDESGGSGTREAAQV